MQVHPPSPYRGLSHFGEDDAGVFFGRDGVVNELTEAVEARRLISLIGAPGSGKTSLVLAGLVPALKGRGLWLSSHFRPSDDPFHALARALVPLYRPETDKVEQLREITDLAIGLREGAVELTKVIDVIQEQEPQSRLLLIADQFEELFIVTENEDLRRNFVDVLLDAISARPDDADFRLKLVIIFRADCSLV